MFSPEVQMTRKRGVHAFLATSGNKYTVMCYNTSISKECSYLNRDKTRLNTHNYKNY